MLGNKVRFPRVEENDDVWQRWIEQQKGKLDICFDGDKGPHGMREQIEWLKRLTQVLTVSSTQQSIRKLHFQHILDVDDDVEDCSELTDALCALVTLLYTQLESLKFSSFKDELFLCFRSVPVMTQLCALDMSYRPSTGKGAHIAELMRKCPNLKYLDLSRCKLKDSDFDAIGSVSCSSLETFRIFGNKLTPRGMKSVAAMLKGCHQIRRVHLCDIEPGNEFGGTSEVFMSLADKTRLEFLYCGGSVLAADELHSLQKLEHLKELSASFVGNDSEFQSLCESIQRMRSLSRLHLDCENQFSLECDRVFADVLRKLDQLVELYFTCAESAASFKYLGEHVASAGCRLRMLDVSGGAGGDLLPVVSALRSNRSLISFGVWNILSDENDIARAVAQALPHNRTLRDFCWNDKLLAQNWTAVVEGARYSAIENFRIDVEGELNDQMRLLVEDVANQGYLVSVRHVQVSESCKQRMELNKRMHGAARKASLTMLAVRRFRRSALNALQYDIVKLIAKSLFATRANDVWSNAFGEQKKPEQKVQKM